jgi:hypothetical protein
MMPKTGKAAARKKAFNKFLPYRRIMALWRCGPCGVQIFGEIKSNNHYLICKKTSIIV